MVTHSAGTFTPVAVVTKSLQMIGKLVIDNPLVESLTQLRFAVLLSIGPITVDVIHYKEFNILFAAALACPAVRCHYRCFE